MGDSRGQATVEFVAALPALLLAALVSLQLLAAGYAMTLADGAAEAGALALASGELGGSGRPRRPAGLGQGRRRCRGQRWHRLGATAPAVAVRGGGISPRGQRRGQRQGRPVSVFERAPDSPLVLVTAVGDAEGSRGAAAALACAGADADRATLLVDVGGRAQRPTLLASSAANQLEERLTVPPAPSACRRPRPGLPPRGRGRARRASRSSRRRRRSPATHSSSSHQPPAPGPAVSCGRALGPASVGVMLRAEVDRRPGPAGPGRSRSPGPRTLRSAC